MARITELYNWIRTVLPSAFVRDSVTGALKTIDVAHDEVHTGSSFIAFLYNADLDDGQVANIRLVAPDTSVRCHLIVDVTGTNATTWALYKDTTHTIGTPLTAFNKEQNSDSAATMTASHTASGGADGTMIEPGAFGEKKTGGGADRGRDEWIVEQGAVWLLQATSRAADNKVVLIAKWYEET